MAAHEIVAIRKPNRDSSHEHITHVQYDGYIWPREHVIELIEKKTDTFYVKDRLGNVVYVGVVHPDYPRDPYIRTYADGKWTDNLLALPPC